MASSLVLDPEDQQSFDYYMRETAAVCSVYSRRHFWTVVVPQASLAHPAVKHSLLALSIVHEAIVFPEGAKNPDDGRLLHHYNAAIRAITQGQPTTDVVLITSMMFFFIDFFRRDGTKAASHHMEAAVNILDEFKATENHTNSPYYETISKHIEPIIQMFGMCLPSGDASVEQPGHFAAAEVALLTGVATASHTIAHVKAIVRSLLHLSTHAMHVADLKAELDRLQMQLFRGLGMLGNLGTTHAEEQLCGRLFFVHHAMAFTFLRELKEQFKIPETLHDDGIIALYTFVVDQLESYLSMPEQLASVSKVEAWQELGVIAPLFAAVVRSPDEDLAERALKLLRNLDCTEGRWTSSMAANIAEALAQADVQDAIGFDLSSLTFERKPHSLRIYAEGQEAACDHYLPLPATELDLMDLVSVSPICYSSP